jgi:hypothetical protein
VHEWAEDRGGGIQWNQTSPAVRVGPRIYLCAAANTHMHPVGEVRKEEPLTHSWGLGQPASRGRRGLAWVTHSPPLSLSLLPLLLQPAPLCRINNHHLISQLT